MEPLPLDFRDRPSGAARHPLLGLAVFYLLGAAAGLRWSAPPFLLILTALLCLLGAWWLRRDGLGSVLLGVALALAAWWNTDLAARPPSPRNWAAAMARDREHVELIGVVCDDPVESSAWNSSDAIRRFTLRLEGVRKEPAWVRAGGTVEVFWRTDRRTPPARYGDRWWARGMMARGSRLEDGSGGYVLRFRPDRVGGRVLSSGHGSRLIAWCLARRRDCFEILGRGLEQFPEAAALQRALLLGYRQDLSPDLTRALSATGTMHIIAISGLHVGIMVALLMAALKTLRLPRTNWALYLIPALTIYAVSTGLNASTVRATLMAALFLAAPMVHRRPDGTNALAAAALAILVAAPLQSVDMGFIMSFAAVAGLLTWMSLWTGPLQARWGRDPWAPGQESFLRGFWRKTGLYLATLILATVAVWLSTAPLTARYFNLVAPFSLLGNLVVVPLSFVVLLTGVLSLLFGSLSAWMAEVFNHANRVFIGIMLDAIRGLAKVRWSYAYVVAPGFAAVSLWYAWLLLVRCTRRAARWLVVAAGLLALGGVCWVTSRSGAARVDVLDVGQGQAILITLPGRCHLLLDPGPDYAGPAVLRHLRRQGVNRLEALVLSHADTEHVGASLLLLDQVPVKEIWCARDVQGRRPHQAILEEANQRDIPVRFWARGDQAMLPGGFEWEVLHPPRASRYARADDASLVVRLARGPEAVLFLGGAGGAVEAELLAQPMDLGATAIIAGDHGVAGSARADWLDAVRPRRAVISVGADNLRGEPDPETLARLAERKIGLWRTDRDGGVRLGMGGGAELIPWTPNPR